MVASTWFVTCLAGSALRQIPSRSFSGVPSVQQPTRQFAMHRMSSIARQSQQQYQRIRLISSRITRQASTSTSSASASSSRSASQPHLTSTQSRIQSSNKAYYGKRNSSLLLYTSAVLVLGIGVTYAAVPLYRIFCSA